ncbi:hypothetical protein HID58_053570 [Brassica napus]|uniref:Assimilatory sulfite reductase (ferredoxin) n=1 Tax=Brassica napus TaxID=3708 RepID=A0ABQ8AGD8_BRANA|nr:hypothetical protein HID58_053570 [Brassica napus]
MTTSFRSPAGAATVFSTDQKILVGSLHALRSSRNVFLGRNVFGGVHSLPPSSSSSSSIQAVSTPAKPTKRSKVEIIKENSNFIRYPLNEELLTESPNVNESAVQLIKFHGSYQQYNREERGGRSYSFMLRTKNPSGKVPNQLYLTMDDLADEFGIGTLRLTTRQTFQLHGVLKHNLKTVMSSIIKNMGSTLGACGDLNRNVLAPAAPYAKKDYLFAQETADNIAALLSPQSGFYYDMWVDGEQFMTAEAPEVVEARNDNSHGTNFVDSPEPIYGTQFLPRKFKIAVTVPTDNSVDLLTNDIGVVVVSDENGEPQEPLGYVPKEDILYAVKAIVVTQREHGRRDDRKYSRMKYLLSSWGIEKFRDVVEQYYGKKFEPPRDLPEWEFKSYLGWHEQGDGAWFCGLHVDSGRVGGNMKKTLREVIEKYRLDVRITPNQNIVLCDIKSEWKRSITTVLAQAGLLQPEFVDPLNQTAMACPAFPLCPLAITEAERGIPSILKRVRAMFEKVGLEYDESVVVRVTGCPNGCARPYMAEIARAFMDKVKIQDLEKVFEPLFYNWKLGRQAKESFGEFTTRMGFEKLKELISTYEGSPQ